MNVRKTIKEFAIISVGTAIVAAAVFFFMLPVSLWRCPLHCVMIPRRLF